MKKSFYRRFLGLSYELENNIILDSIKRGFLMTLPALFIGAIALVIISFPVASFQTGLHHLWSGALYQFCDVLYQATYGFLSLYLTINISYNCAKRLMEKHVFSQSICVMTSVMCLTEALGLGSKDFSYTVYGNTGTFTAIVVAICVPFLFSFIQNHLKAVENKGILMVDELDYQHLDHIFIPFFASLVLFGFINILLVHVCKIASLNELFASFFGNVFKSMGPNLFSGLLFVFLSGLLWFFGIHGGNTLELVSQNVFVPANTLPDTIISKSFIDVFGLMGGSGATICLLIALLLFAKEKNHRGLAKASIAMVTFNVNEIMVFGMPIMFNPVMLIPFLITPMISVAVAYAAVALGFMPITTTTITWTTPVLFSGYALTGSWVGTLVQILNIGLGILIYVPFVKLMEKVERERAEFLLDEIESDFKEELKYGRTLCLNDMRHGLDRMYHAMVVAIYGDINQHKIPVHFQPQVDKNGQIVGAEALLRWNYQNRAMFPPLVVEMAKEEGYMDLLSLEILKASCEATRQLLAQYPNFKMSVNMVGDQMNDKKFVEQALALIHHYELEPYICLEITEETSLDNMEYVEDNIQYLKREGIRLALDDFSMGHTSLKYLQENLFDYVKLDGALVKDMMENERSETIVRSIVSLGERLNFNVIAEYVDTPQKRDRLIEMGCTYLQGYLYSPAVSLEDFWMIPMSM